MAGEYPFDENSKEHSLQHQIKHGLYHVTGHRWKHISEEAKSLIKSLLCVRVKDRLTAEQALQHDWFVNKENH